MEERELIRACRSGDETAFEALVRLHEKKVYALCRRMCPNEQDALEAAQDAFLALWRGIGDFREDAALSTWLYRLAANACIDVLRRERRSGGAVSLDDPDTVYEPVDQGDSPERALEQSELRRLVGEGIAALPEEYRRVLLLRETEQLSYSEIAAREGLELGTVKSRISRARRQLGNYLCAAGNFLDGVPSKDTEENRKGERRK